MRKRDPAMMIIMSMRLLHVKSDNEGLSWQLSPAFPMATATIEMKCRERDDDDHDDDKDDDGDSNYHRRT